MRGQIVAEEMISFEVEIYNDEKEEWEDYTNKAVFNPIIGEYLDKQLDELTLQLKLVPTEYFEPNTLIRVSFSDSYERTMLIAGDDSSLNLKVKSKTGKELFDHDLRLIELTKLMEGFVSDSMSFTNALGRTYIE